MVQAIRQGQATPPASDTRPAAAAAATPAAATPALTRDSVSTTPAANARPQLPGIWGDRVIGNSQHAYRITVPKTVPAGFTLDEAHLSPADREALRHDPSLREAFTKLDYLMRTDPQAREAFQDYVGSARNGDLVLRTYGTTTKPPGVWRAFSHGDGQGPGRLYSLPMTMIGGDWSHVAIVSRHDANAAPTVVESLMEGGVFHNGLYTFLAPVVSGSNPRNAVTLVRATENRQEADAAEAYAERRVGTPYNYEMTPARNNGTQDPRLYCSQLAYAAYELNPAIHRTIFAPMAGQAYTHARLSEAMLSGLAANDALQNMFTGAHAHDRGGKPVGVVRDLARSWAHEGIGGMARRIASSTVAVGGVVADRVTATVTRHDPAPPTVAWDGRQVAAFAPPGALAPNDGRKLVTIVLDHQP